MPRLSESVLEANRTAVCWSTYRNLLRVSQHYRTSHQTLDKDGRFGAIQYPARDPLPDVFAPDLHAGLDPNYCRVN